MADVAVTAAKNPAAPAKTAAERAKNPVIVRHAPAPAAVKSTRDQAADTPAGGALDKLSAADQVRVRVAVDDHAARIYRSPLVGGSKSSVGRYLAEGPLSKVTDRYGLSTVWEAVAEVVNEQPDALTRSDADVKAAAKRRADEAERLANRAADLFQAGDAAEALALVDQAEQLNPDQRVGGDPLPFTFDELRKIIGRKPVTPPPAATPDVPVSEPEHDPAIWLAEQRAARDRAADQLDALYGRRPVAEVRAEITAEREAAQQLDITGGSTAFTPASRSTIGLSDRPNVGRDSGPAAQQLGMFDVSDQRQLPGQEALLDAMFRDPYDRPTVTAVQRPDLDAPAIPADLSTVDDATLDRYAGRATDADRPLIEAEQARRDNAAAYRQLVESVPDADGLKGLSDDDVMALFAKITAVDGDPDPGAFARLGAELDRRTEAEAAERERPLREFVNWAIESGSDEDLDIAARHASTLGDDNAIERVYAEWDRREAAEAARIEAERQAAQRAEAERLAAEQAAQREQAAQVARENAEREQLAAEFRTMSQQQVATEFASSAASMDPANQKRHAAAVAELKRRDDIRKEDETRAKAVERRRRMMSGPVKSLGDDELGDAIADIEADGLNSNAVRQRRLVELHEERAARAAEHARLAALRAAVPTAPLRHRNPIGEVGALERWGEHSHAVRDRLQRARMAALGVAMPEAPANRGPDMGWREQQKAIKKAIVDAEKSDPRSAQEQAAMILAHYRHQAEIDGVSPSAEWAQYERGPDDDPTAPPLRKATPAENIPKAYEVWREIRIQANADRHAGNTATATRYQLATARALGLPDDATDDEIRSAYGADRRTSGQLTSQMIVEYRAQARADGVDPSDRLRYGPPERGTSRAKVRPSHHAASDPAIQEQIDRLVARGWDYLDAYAEVHNLDVDGLRRQAAGEAAAGGKARGGTEKAFRQQYDEWLHLRYLEAEKATRGHLLSPAGKAKSVDALALFSGPLSRARLYASEDLLRWWAENPRMTFAEFRANVTGGARASRARAAAASAGRDFV